MEMSDDEISIITPNPTPALSPATSPATSPIIAQVTTSDAVPAAEPAPFKCQIHTQFIIKAPNGTISVINLVSHYKFIHVARW